jgi:hypothetical protein
LLSKADFGPEELPGGSGDVAALAKKDRPVLRKVDIFGKHMKAQSDDVSALSLRDALLTPLAAGEKRLHLSFLHSPLELLPSGRENEGPLAALGGGGSGMGFPKLGEMLVQRNEMVPLPEHDAPVQSCSKQRSRPVHGSTCLIPCDLAFRSVGYKALPLVRADCWPAAPASSPSSN